MPPEVLNWQHIVAEALVTMVGSAFTFAVGLWFSHRASVKDADRREQARGFVLIEHPPHSHGEYKDENSEGPLRAENIRFPRVRINGSKS